MPAMEFKYTCCILQRVLLPSILGICLLFRPVGISYIYLLMFLLLPFIPLVKLATFRASLTAYFVVLITLSAIISTCHIGLAITGRVLGPESFLENCSFEEVLIRQIGFIYIGQLSVISTLQWIWPDVLVLICSLLVFVLMKRLSRTAAESIETSTNGEEGRKTETSEYKIFQKMGPLASLASLFLASAFRPSVPGGFYFLMFLFCTTYWACKRSLSRGFAMLLRFIMLILVFHTVAIISYQTSWVQIKLSNSTLPARLMGLEPITLPICTSQNEEHDLIIFNPDLSSDSYLNPVMILICYYILALTSNYLMKNKVSSWQNRPSEPHERTPLMNRNTKKSTEERSMVVETDNIELENLRTNEEDVTTSFLDHIWYGVLSSCAFVYKNSYIFTNILMMVWSIVYHSWLTFVLLIWANILWMIPNQRKTMLKSSPFIVLYAELLLVAQYIYGMKLEQYELPDKVDMKGINLEQIGLVKSKEMPCVPLFVKTAFTLMFWLTLKQRCKEEEEKKKTSTLADMVAPLQLTVGTATSDMTPKPMEQKTSKFFEKIGSFIKTLLIKLWIWLLLIIVFVSGITGTKMTGFRICYMAMFLFFVLAFQCSWKAWIKVMYGFWLFLIFYGMSILILIYTYQFDRFDEYWNDYLNISKSLQKDIGLERYETKDLFLHLVTPTVLVIMTIIHIHYFHNRFVENLKQDVSERARSISPDVDLAALNEQGTDEVASGTEGDGQFRSQTEDELGTPKTNRLKGLRKLSKARVQRLYTSFKSFVKGFMEFLWTLFEIHLIKVIFLTVIICCFAKICILHILFVFLSVAAFMSRTWVQICISRFISVLVSILMLGNMIYQVDYLDHKKYNVNCKNETITATTPNNARWFGLEKIPQSDTLLYLLRGYIVYIVITTIHAVVVFRQEQKRARQGLPLDRPAVIFTKITKKDAEKDLLGLIKYLFNYCYFRFGYEITLVVLVSTIAYRQDLLAIIYSLWFCILICLERERSENIWFLFSCFVAIVIPAQYILFVGFPPSLCIVYPWEGISTEGLYAWAMLPGPSLQHESGKVIFDFVLLLFISRQRRVYAIEKPFEKSNTIHPGGSNKSLLLDTESQGLAPSQNAVHDFKSVVRNWLDILHVFIFSGFYWITLAVIFLAGTNVISMFSVGYLGGSFIFLWQGTDFYLRPIKKIVQRWKIFLAYNVIVITLKTFLQIGVCLFFKDLTKHTCWLVHFLGVGCVGRVNPETKECPALRDNSGLVWDATCFVFLIFQLRIFSSYYFQHVINDTKASAILASRGAVLIEDLRQKQIQHRTRHEKEILRKIKAKMEKIRATQQKIVQPAEKPTHFEEKEPPRIKPPKTHGQAMRAGDYYMFDVPDEKIELSLMDDGGDFLEDEGKISASERKISKRKGLFEDKEKAAESLDSPDQPSSSKDIPPEKHDEKQEKGAVAKIFEGIMVSLAISLNRLSRNYRYVMKILSNEKKTLKESMKAIKPGLRETWIPYIKTSDEEATNTNSKKKKYKDTAADHYIDTQTISDSDDDANDNTTRASGETSIAVIGPEPEEFDWDENEFTTREHHIVVEVLISGWYAILSNTDIICYLFVFINQITSASILSIPLPIMVFMWGTLAIPRPTKSFWVTLIAYTQCVVIIKCMFQFKTFAFQNVNLPNQPLSADKIIGIEQKDNYAIYDLLLLLVLFLHRFILKSQGLWDSHDLEPIVQSGTYIVKDELPEDDDNGSVQELQQTVIVTKGRDTLVITKKQLGDSSQDNELNLEVSDKIDETGSYVPEVVKITSAKYFSPVVDFFKNLLYKSRLPSDVYALMFLCDFVNFFVLLFGCPAFGTQYGDGGVHTYFTENKVPIPFLIMLLVQFILIVVDRALYLRKALVFKIVFHFSAIIGIHIWMFFVLPAITERQFNALVPPVMFYLIKCFYFLLSSYQITCGYPKRILGNFLTRGYTLINMISFKIYKLLPFLFELRTFLDWVCTDTTMTIWEWLKMENIFSEIYFIKCSRDIETSFPVPRAQKKDMIMKIILGGSAILLWVIVIWAPLTTYAVFTAVGESNIPTEISVVMKIGPYSPIYIMQSQDAVSAFDIKDMTQLQSFYLQNKSAMTFITSYYESDIATISLPAHSQTVWGISPPERETLLNELLQNHTLPVRFFYKITKLSSGKNDEEDILSTQTYYELQKEGRESLILMLQGKPTDGYILVPNIFPKFIEIKNTNKIHIISKLMPNEQQYVSLLLRLSTKTVGGETMWWHVTENCNDTIHRELLSDLPHAECGKAMTIYTFNDKKFPRSFLGLFSASGIIGMYTGIVLVFSRIVRGVIFDSTSRIMFSDLPYVDRVLQLCLDVYLVREAKEFALEEDLFAKLLFLYRSPETMIKWTRPKEEGTDNYSDDRPTDGGTSYTTTK